MTDKSPTSMSTEGLWVYEMGSPCSWRSLNEAGDPRERFPWNRRGYLVLPSGGDPLLHLQRGGELDRMRCDYPGFHGCTSWCYLQVRGNVVLATEPEAEDAGTSITNLAEDLATWVCHALRLPPGDLRWIEGYDYRPEQVAQVSFHLATGDRLVRPQWRSIPSMEHYENLPPSVILPLPPVVSTVPEQHSADLVSLLDRHIDQAGLRLGTSRWARLRILQAQDLDALSLAEKLELRILSRCEERGLLDAQEVTRA